MRTGAPWFSAAAAVAVTAVAAFLGGRFEEPVRDSPLRLVPHADGVARSESVLLTHGRYRASATVEIDRGAHSGVPAARELAWLGLVPHGAQDGKEGLPLRPLDFARDDSRVVHFAFRIRKGEPREWLWREAGGRAGVRPVHLHLARERPLWTRGPGCGAALSGGAFGGGVAACVLLGALALLAARGPTARVRGNAAPVHGSRRAGGVQLTLLGLAGYLAAGLALFAALAGAGSAWPASAGTFWTWLPWTSGVVPPTGLALRLLLGAAGAALFGLVVRRVPGLVWSLPVAMIGLLYAGTLVGPKSDFQVYYNAGLALWTGSDPYALRPERVLNPPPFVLACSLFPLLPVWCAGFVWFGVKAAAAAWCVPFARRALAPCPGPDPVGTGGGTGATRLARMPAWIREGLLRPEWLGAIAAARLIGMDLQYGNTNVLVLTTLLGTAAAWGCRRPGIAAGALAAGVAIKVTPLVAVLAVGLAGRVRWAAATLALSLAILGLSAVALESRASGAGSGFLREAVPRPGDLSMGRVDNQSLRGLTDRLVGGARVNLKTGQPGRSFHLGARSARATEVALDLLVLAALYGVARRAAREAPGTAAARPAWADLWAAAALAILLVSPGSWTVHFALLYLPLVVIAGRMRAGSRVAAALFALSVPVIVLPAFSRTLTDLFTATSSLTLLALALLAGLLAAPRRHLFPRGAGC